METKTFASWMRAVNAELIRRVGLDSRDLADCPYTDWFGDGVTPRRAAARAIRENGGENL